MLPVVHGSAGSYADGPGPHAKTTVTIEMETLRRRREFINRPTLPRRWSPLANSRARSQGDAAKRRVRTVTCDEPAARKRDGVRNR